MRVFRFEKIKKLFCAFLAAVCILTLCSCSGTLTFESQEQKAYRDTISSLFDALDQQDRNAVLGLFAPSVRQTAPDLQAQIEELLSVYPGPTDEIGWDGLLGGESHYEDGNHTKEASATFPVRSGDDYFWCYLLLMYENTVDSNQVGIVQLDFYTADEYCIFRYDEDAKYRDDIGLKVYAEQTLEEDVRCINGNPHKYSSATAPLNLQDVQSFFESSNRFSAFQAQFGPPNAENIYHYYELPGEDGKPRYLEIGADADEIFGAHIVSDLQYIADIFDGEE